MPPHAVDDLLTAPLLSLRGIGPRRASELERAGLLVVDDLLYRFPLRYEDRSRITPIAQLQPLSTACVAGEIIKAGLRSTRRPGFTLFELTVRDEAGTSARARFFNQRFLRDVFHPGQQVFLFGRVQLEAGGVVLEIANAEALAHAIDAILATVRATRPEAGIAGVRVQTMQRGVAELLAGLVREPRIGALILVGPGGWAAERHGRCSLRLAPVSAETALAMIDEVWEFLPGTVPRASVAAGLAAAARAIHRLSLLAWAPEVLEAEINPLIVSADAAVGVDALVTLAP